MDFRGAWGGIAQPNVEAFTKDVRHDTSSISGPDRRGLVGLLAVDAGPQAVKEVVSLPQDPEELLRMRELHSIDLKREIELADYIRSSLQ